MIPNATAAEIKTSNLAVSGKTTESINVTTMSTNTAKRSESVEVLVKTEKTNLFRELDSAVDMLLDEKDPCDEGGVGYPEESRKLL